MKRLFIIFVLIAQIGCAVPNQVNKPVESPWHYRALPPKERNYYCFAFVGGFAVVVHFYYDPKR